MTLTTRTIQFNDSDLRGPAHEQAKIAAAFLKNCLPEVSVATCSHIPAIIIRGVRADAVALASAAVMALENARPVGWKLDSFQK